jgi:hypothetical protein
MSVENRFRQDLEDPNAGTNSDLYSTLSPMISPDANSLSKADAARISDLQSQVRKGLVGLEYATGLKSNKGETFYDKHPAQAVASDVSSAAVPIGLGVAGLGIGSNILKERKNMHMTEPASMSRKENPLGDATNPSRLLDPTEGAAREDIARMFGDFESNPEQRLELIDRLNKQNKAHPDSFTAKHENLKAVKNKVVSDYEGQAQKLTSQLSRSSPAGVKKIEAQLRALKDQHTSALAQLDKTKKKIFTEARSSGGASALPGYVDVHESLQRAKTKGGLKGYHGEGLHRGEDGLMQRILKRVAPGSYEAVGDLLEKRKITGAHPHFDESLIKDIVREYRGGGDFSSLDPKGKAFVETTLKRLQDPAHQSSGIRKLFSRVKAPLAAGAATTAGLMGLHQLLKAIQNQTHSSDQIKDWKKTLLQSRGDFDAANRIQ